MLCLRDLWARLCTSGRVARGCGRLKTHVDPHSRRQRNISGPFQLQPRSMGRREARDPSDSLGDHTFAVRHTAPRRGQRQVRDRHPRPGSELDTHLPEGGPGQTGPLLTTKSISRTAQETRRNLRRFFVGERFFMTDIDVALLVPGSPFTVVERVREPRSIPKCSNDFEAVATGPASGRCAPNASMAFGFAHVVRLWTTLHAVPNAIASKPYTANPPPAGHPPARGPIPGVRSSRPLAAGTRRTMPGNSTFGLAWPSSLPGGPVSCPTAPQPRPKPRSRRVLCRRSPQAIRTRLAPRAGPERTRSGRTAAGMPPTANPFGAGGSQRSEPRTQTTVLATPLVPSRIKRRATRSAPPRPNRHLTASKPPDRPLLVEGLSARGESSNPAIDGHPCHVLSPSYPLRTHLFKHFRLTTRPRRPNPVSPVTKADHRRRR